MSEITLVTSNYNFSHADSLLKNPYRLIEDIIWAHFDGIEWNDIPNVHPYNLFHGEAAYVFAKEGLITSMQQSFQSTRLRDIPEQFTEKRQAAGMVAAAKEVVKQAAIIGLLPNIETSLDKLQRVQQYAGKKLPVIVHPNEQQLGDASKLREIDYAAIRRAETFGALNFQLTAEHVAALGVPLVEPHETVDQLYDALAGRNEFDGIVFDTHHAMTERNGYTLPDPITIAGRLAHDGRLAELQVAWRPDFGGDAADIGKALNGHIEDTPQGQCIAAVRKNLPDDSPLYAAIEVPAVALGKDYWPVLGELAMATRRALSD